MPISTSVDMLSLKRFLDGSPEDTARDVMELLLDGIASHMPVLDAGEFEYFQRSIQKLKAKIVESQDGRQGQILGASVVERVDSYSRGIEKLCRMESSELKSIVTLLTQSLLNISHASQASASTLKSVERELAQASELTDIRMIKAKIAESLETICEEAGKQASQAASVASELAATATRPLAITERDLITGLPTVDAAKASISDRAGKGLTSWAALLFIERMETINKRFGFKAGDQMMLLFSRHIAQQLTPEDELFRWRGPMFVAILERATPAFVVSAEVRRISTSRLDYAVTLGERDIFIPITSSFSVVPITPESDLNALIDSIDEFASAH